MSIRMLWSVNFWSLEASRDNDVEDMRLGVGRGGTDMCFHLRLQLLIHDHGSLAGNRAQWIMFKGVFTMRLLMRS